MTMTAPAKKPTTVHAAKTHLSRLIDRALRGEEVVIHRGKVPVVRLVPVQATPVERKFGAMKGRVVVPTTFFDELPTEELDAWAR